MVQNYMDLSYDNCMNLFTRGQRAVMRNNLFLYRGDVIRDRSLITGVSPEQPSLQVQVLDAGTLIITSPDPAGEISLIDVLGRPIPFAEAQSTGTRTLTLYGAVKGVCIVVMRQHGRRFVQRLMVN